MYLHDCTEIWGRCVQLAGPGVVPFGPNKQTLLLDALYNQLADTCQIATARPGEVRGNYPCVC